MGILRIVPHVWEKRSGEGDARSAQWSETGYWGRTGSLPEELPEAICAAGLSLVQKQLPESTLSEWCPKAGALAHRLCSQGNMQLSGLGFSVGCIDISAIVQSLTTSMGQELSKDFTPHGKCLQSDKWSPLPHLQCLTLLTPCTVPVPCSTHTHIFLHSHQVHLKQAQLDQSSSQNVSVSDKHYINQMIITQVGRNSQNLFSFILSSIARSSYVSLPVFPQAQYLLSVVISNLRELFPLEANSIHMRANMDNFFFPFSPSSLLLLPLPTPWQRDWV